MSAVPQTHATRTLTELRAWMKINTFHRFVTFTFNDLVSDTLCRERLKEWDARINRKILGPQWSKMRDARLFAFFGMEKQDRNPHWHGVIKLCSTETKTLNQICTEFDQSTERIWTTLVPAGTVDVKAIENSSNSRDFVDYLTKSVTFEDNFARFIVPDEFSPQYPAMTWVKGN